MSRMLILGASGMLGHKVCQVLSHDGRHEVVGTVMEPASAYARYGEIFGRCRLVGGLDALNDADLERTFDRERPEFVINCIGIVKQLKEAQDPYLSVGLNSFLPHRLARLCGRHGAKLVHVSTDCVFSGRKGRYAEDDASDADDLYGRSKYLGETTEQEPAAVTVRTSIVGRELLQPAHALVEWFLAQRGRKVRGFAGAIYTGLTTLEMARVFQTVLDHRDTLCGLYHVTSQAISKYDLLHLMRRLWNLDVEIERDEVFQCDRSMVMGRFAQATGYVAPSWEEMLLQMRNDPTPYDRWRLEAAAGA